MDQDIFEQYGEETNPGNIIGAFLKFSEGGWIDGRGEKFPIGKRMIANMDRLLLCWIRWEDKQPAERIMGLLAEGFKPPPRDILGYGYEPGNDKPVDTSEWELDAEGNPRDPWRFTRYLILKDPDYVEEGEGIYTFVTSSNGGKKAIGDLCKTYGRKRREGHRNYYPVIALRNTSYMHRDRSFGKVKEPALWAVGWVFKSAFGELPLPDAAPLQLAAPVQKQIPHFSNGFSGDDLSWRR
jgi:hypothetical protein